MKTIKLVKQVGNKSVGIFENNEGGIVAMTLTRSKDFKTVKGAESWLAKKGF